MEFDFVNYDKERKFCIKPIDDGNAVLDNLNLGYYNHCTDPSTEPNEELKDEFYSGKGRFYYYDVKLCHTTNLNQYNSFITEFIRRGEEYPCILHISNSTVPNRFNSLSSVYDISYFTSILARLTTIKSDIIVEISNKRIEETPDYDMYKIEKISKFLKERENVKHYMLREEIYNRHIKLDNVSYSGINVWFEDNYTLLHEEVIRYDEIRNNQRD